MVLFYLKLAEPKVNTAGLIVDSQNFHEAFVEFGEPILDSMYWDWMSYTCRWRHDYHHRHFECVLLTVSIPDCLW